VVRILFLADSHLGIDLPRRPRVVRRRRGDDFLANYHRILTRATAGDIDMVVHGGDLFFRSRIPAHLVEMGFAPLREVADHDVPVFIVPGNHERSHIPHPILSVHDRIHIFDRPRTFVTRCSGVEVAVAGFPFHRVDVRARFAELVRSCSCPDHVAVKILCLHHAVEGATVGAHDFTFRTGDDVIRAADLPDGFAAILSGHIHRHQVLTKDLAGSPLPTPVYYPGSIERTSFAEQSEDKGYLILDVAATESGGRVTNWQLCPLPARPMLRQEIRTHARESPQLLRRRLIEVIARLPVDAVVELHVSGAISSANRAVLAAASLRELTPPTMNLRLAGAAVRHDESEPTEKTY
jgi:exonuclease SbcD